MTRRCTRLAKAIAAFLAMVACRVPVNTSVFLSSPSTPRAKGKMVGAAHLGGLKSFSGRHCTPALVSQSATFSLPLTTGSALTALLVGMGATVCALRRCHRAAVVRRCAYVTYSPKEWVSRVKMVEGDRAVFDVVIPKPLGLIPANFPNRPGVGVARINPDGNTDALNKKVLIDNEPGMFVLEGDEVLAVNGQTVEGKDLEDVAPLVKASEGDSITLTLCRHHGVGPVKVVFLPSGAMATMKRGAEIRQATSVGVQEVSYSCQEGWCKSCWHTETMWGTVFRACDASSPKRPPPKNPRTIPANWVNVLPLFLMNWPESLKRAKKMAGGKVRASGA